MGAPPFCFDEDVSGIIEASRGEKPPLFLDEDVAGIVEDSRADLESLPVPVSGMMEASRAERAELVDTSLGWVPEGMIEASSADMPLGMGSEREVNALWLRCNGRHFGDDISMV